MDKQAVFIQVFCSSIAGAAASSRGRVNDINLATAVEAATKSVQILEEELKQYEKKRPGRPAATKVNQ